MENLPKSYLISSHLCATSMVPNDKVPVMVPNDKVPMVPPDDKGPATSMVPPNEYNGPATRMVPHDKVPMMIPPDGPLGVQSDISVLTPNSDKIPR